MKLTKVKNYEDKYYIDEFGNVYSLKTKNQIKPFSSFGYLRVSLWKNNKCKKYRAHRLVWESFIGRIPACFVINHKDRNRSNNHLSNLEVITQSENVKHAKNTNH